MKSVTKKTQPKTLRLKYNKDNYNFYYPYPPVNFVKKCLGFRRCFFMSAEEFSFLTPRLIHSEIIGWTPIKEGHDAIKAEIYITDGTRGEGAAKIPVAYSYYVRFNDQTWKPAGLDFCFEIINELRLHEQAQQLEMIKMDIEDEKEAKKKK